MKTWHSRLWLQTSGQYFCFVVCAEDVEKWWDWDNRDERLGKWMIRWIRVSGCKAWTKIATKERETTFKGCVPSKLNNPFWTNSFYHLAIKVICPIGMQSANLLSCDTKSYYNCCRCHPAYRISQNISNLYQNREKSGFFTLSTMKMCVCWSAYSCIVRTGVWANRWCRVEAE